MTSNTVDRLVDDYLTRLADAARDLPADRRTELLAEIREHIAASMAGGTGMDEVAARTTLDRLGEPDDIVAAAAEDNPPEHPAYPMPQQGRRQGIGLEVGAVIMLTLGSFIPLIGWFVGVILLWSSGVWRRSEKLMGTLIFPGGPALVLFIGPMAATYLSFPTSPCLSTASTDPTGQQVMPAEVCTGSVLPGVLGIAVLLIALLAQVVVAIVLLKRARARTELENH